MELWHTAHLLWTIRRMYDDDDVDDDVDDMTDIKHKVS